MQKKKMTDERVGQMKWRRRSTLTPSAFSLTLEKKNPSFLFHLPHSSPGHHIDESILTAARHLYHGTTISIMNFRMKHQQNLNTTTTLIVGYLPPCLLSPYAPPYLPLYANLSPCRAHPALRYLA
ncbi:hypothetical protein RND81_09G067300 [Saponaria officinalis]|uniref:Uncharacterized protein n=1 Tax=Saponaria officinalis TaxID=3572 RepID=A0AAW1IHL1_SAPOF